MDSAVEPQNDASLEFQNQSLTQKWLPAEQEAILYIQFFHVSLYRLCDSKTRQ